MTNSQLFETRPLRNTPFPENDIFAEKKIKSNHDGLHQQLAVKIRDKKNRRGKPDAGYFDSHGNQAHTKKKCEFLRDDDAVFASGVKDNDFIHKKGKKNRHADGDQIGKK